MKGSFVLDFYMFELPSKNWKKLSSLLANNYKIVEKFRQQYIEQWARES